MTALLYVISIFGSVGQTTLGKQYTKKGGQATDFNICKAASGALFFLIAGLIGGLEFHLPTVMIGAVYGVFLCIAMYTGLEALALGPMGLTGMIGSFSLVIPLLFGLIAWDETLSGFGIAGLCLLAASLIMINYKAGGGTSLKWAVYALSTMAANGFCSVAQKYHQRSFPGQYRTEFMLSALTVITVLLVMKKILKKESFKPSPSGFAAGIFNGVSQYIVLLLAAAVKASVLFPVLSVSNIMAAWAVGLIFFKEKTSLKQAAGLLCGLVSLILLNISA